MARMEDKLKTEQVAEALDLSVETIRRLIVKGTIKAKFKYGNPRLGYRVERRDLAVYLRSVGEEELAVAIESGTLPEMAAAS